MYEFDVLDHFLDEVFLVLLACVINFSCLHWVWKGQEPPWRILTLLELRSTLRCLTGTSVIIIVLYKIVFTILYCKLSLLGSPPITILYWPQVTLKVWVKSELVEFLSNLGVPPFLPKIKFCLRGGGFFSSPILFFHWPWVTLKIWAESDSWLRLWILFAVLVPVLVQVQGPGVIIQ